MLIIFNTKYSLIIFQTAILEILPPVANNYVWIIQRVSPCKCIKFFHSLSHFLALSISLFSWFLLLLCSQVKLIYFYIPLSLYCVCIHAKHWRTIYDAAITLFFLEIKFMQINITTLGWKQSCKNAKLYSHGMTETFRLSLTKVLNRMPYLTQRNKLLAIFLREEIEKIFILSFFHMSF